MHHSNSTKQLTALPCNYDHILWHTVTNRLLTSCVASCLVSKQLASRSYKFYSQHSTSRHL